MSKKTILIITDNVPDQINGVVVTFKNMEKHALLDGYKRAILECLKLDKDKVKQSSEKWTWEECWKIFRDNLISIK